MPFVVCCDFLLMTWNDPAYGFRMARRITGIGLLYLVGTISLFLGLSQHMTDTNNAAPTTTINSTNATNTADIDNNNNTSNSNTTTGAELTPPRQNKD